MAGCLGRLSELVGALHLSESSAATALASRSNRARDSSSPASSFGRLDHPHICSIYDVGSVDGSHYLVMPHFEGETRAERLEHGRLPIDDALKIAVEMADALEQGAPSGDPPMCWQ